MITDQCSALDLTKEIDVLAAGMELDFFHLKTYWTVIPSNINAEVLCKPKSLLHLVELHVIDTWVHIVLLHLYLRGLVLTQVTLIYNKNTVLKLIDN